MSMNNDTIVMSMNKDTKMEDCKFYEDCSAPICPMTEDNSQYIWYPDEDICRNKTYADCQWIKTQKKIQKVATNVETYYTMKMLNRNIVVKDSITGLDPDKIEGSNEDQLKRIEDKHIKDWLDKHPEITTELKDIKSKTMKKINVEKSHRL